MISPNGAPGGNYEGYRSQILGELMGLSNTDFLAEEIHTTDINNAEAALAAHLKKEPPLKQATAGDVLAGFLASLVASGAEPIHAAALAPYFHGRAADTLAKEFSSFGVIPSDLPRQIARELATFQNGIEEI